MYSSIVNIPSSIISQWLDTSVIYSRKSGRKCANILWQTTARNCPLTGAKDHGFTRVQSEKIITKVLVQIRIFILQIFISSNHRCFHFEFKRDTQMKAPLIFYLLRK